jgi:hypothetical protein
MQRYGPVSASDLELLKAKLEKHGLAHEAVFDQDIYIDLADEAFILVRPDLDRMGVAAPLGTGEVEMVDEYLCLSCDYISTTPGNCPTHHEPLLEFGDWTRAKSLKKDQWGGLFGWFFIAAIIAFIVYFKFFGNGVMN